MLKIAPGLVGAIVSVSVIFDALTDPLMGYISDYTTFKRLGRRHGYLIIGALGIALFNALLWSIDPAWDKTTKLILLTVWLFCTKLFLTVFGTPYNALGAELTDDYHKRTTVQAFKTAFFILGFLFPSVAGMAFFFRPTPEYPTGQLNPSAYFEMGLLASVLTLFFAGVCIYATLNHTVASKPATPSVKGVFSDMVSALKARDFRNIVIGYLFINISSSLVSAVGLHVLTYTYDISGNAIAGVFGTLFGVAVVSQPLWTYIAKRKEKKTALLYALYASLIGSAGFLATVYVRDNHALCYVLLVVCAVIMGLSIGGCLSLPYSMLTDTLDVDEYHTGKRKEGVYYGAITFTYKLSQALIVFLAGIVMTFLGFDPELPKQLPHVSASLGYLLPIGFLCAFVPAILIFRKYTLTKEKIREIQEKIRREKDDNHQVDAG